MQNEFDREKFKDAMHYVIAKAGDHPGFGATKLYKVLWFAESRMFVLHQSPIYSAEFIREKHGPVPRLAMPVREELQNEGRVRIWQDRFHNRSQWRFLSLVPPSMHRFNRDEIGTLDYWIKHIDQDHTAETISEASHDYAWEIARMGEPLPLYSCLAERLRDPTDSELAKAQRRLGLSGQ